MPVSLEIISIPLGSILVRSIGANDPDDLNDFAVLIIADANGTGLEERDITLSTGASLVALTGSGVTWHAVIRPPTTAGMLTITIAANAFAEGNTETSQDIRISTSFPDTDAEEATELFTVNLSGVSGIAVSPTRILISHSSNIYKYSYDGTEQTSEQQAIGTGGDLDYFNDTLLVSNKRYSLKDGALIETYSGISPQMHTKYGFLEFSGTFYRRLPYGETVLADNIPFTVPLSRGRSYEAYQNSLIYGTSIINQFTAETFFWLARLTAVDSIEFVKHLNITTSTRIKDIAISGDTLYSIEDIGTTGEVNTLDIRKYRPLSLNTKTTIYPVFATNGDTIPLKQFCPDGTEFTFSVGFDKPSYLSINASNELVVGTGGDVVLVKLTAINRIDSIDLEFYLVILQAAAPKVRDVDSLTMRAGSSYDLFQIVPDAETIAFRAGRTRLAGSSLSNGIFRIGTVGGKAHFTARKGSRSSHIEIEIVVIQASDPSNFSDIFRHHVEIAGIDVTADVSVFPTVSATLDAVTLNNYQPNEVVLTLKSNNLNDYKYNDGVADNFWQSNNLNPGGFKEHIKIFIESLVNGRYVSHLLFSGTISKANELIGDAGVQLTCLDESIAMQETLVEDFGTLEKWDTLRRQSDESNLEGVYVPEASLLPMQIAGAQAWNDRRKMLMSRLSLPSEGPALTNTGHLTPSQFLTSGGYLESDPVLSFMAEHLSEDVRFFISQVALNKVIYNAEINLPAIELDEPFILNRGSVAFSVERTRNTRILTDWVYDATNDRILMLLSNPEAHIADLLVQYDLNSDAYRVLYAFDKDVVVHQIERRNGTNYYILSSKPIPQDRSAQRLPRTIDSTGYAYDSAATGSEIKIWHYSTSSGTLTEHVAENNTRPPQLGIHYWVGFENEHYIDEFEGSVPHYRGVFKWQGSHLYYRYATDSEFGVARVNTGGTTEEMIDQAVSGYHDHLNFAFDINSSGTIYFVYATGNAHSSTLTIKRRTSGGTETTILADTKALGGFSALGEDFGAYLGAMECLFHDNYLYILAPTQKLDFGEDATNTAADPDFIIEIEDTGMTGERYVTTSTNLNPTSTRLALGDDIPIRIDFNSSVSGAVQSNLRASGGSITAFAISSDMIDITIRPDDPTRHKNIVIELARNAVDQNNEATRIIVDFGTRRSRKKSAGAVLYRCNVTAATPSLEVLETYDFVQLGACNLVVHDGSVHFVENPPAGAKFKPINHDLDGYYTDEEKAETMGYNLVPESLGALKRINSAGESESLGNLWFEERPSNIAATRCLSIDGDLHVTMAYGNLDEILRANSLASKPDNVQHLVYGKKLHYVLPTLDTNTNRYALLADIAKKVNATLSFKNGLIVVRDRNPYRAETDGNTGTGTANLGFDNAKKRFPDSGYLLIGKEILKFTGISSSAFTGIARGILATEIVNHVDNTPILYLDEVLESNRILGKPTFPTDTTRVYNVIRNADNTVEERDETSIAKYGELPYTLDLGLTKHELAWQAYIFKNYLEHLKEPQKRINLTLKPTNYLEIGQIIGVKYEMLVYAVQILSITKNEQSTQIRGRTV